MSRFLFLLALLPCGSLASAAEREDAELVLARAGTAVQAARRDDAATYATAEFATAQTLLEAALDAYDARAWTNSVIYAERARADGDLAAARSREVRAESAAAELERSLDDLRARRTSGGSP